MNEWFLPQAKKRDERSLLNGGLVRCGREQPSEGELGGRL
jgi:hypothetical protein